MCVEWNSSSNLIQEVKASTKLQSDSTTVTSVAADTSDNG